MLPNVSTLNPLTLPRDMVRVMFALDQVAPMPALETLPGQVWRWNHGSPAATAVNVTYGFSTSTPSYAPGPNVVQPANYQAYTDAERLNVATVLAAYQAVAGISFELLADGDAAQMVFRKTELIDAAGFAFFPPFSVETALNGDAYFEPDSAAGAYLTFHEVGHALGLDHAYDESHPNPEDYGIAGGRLLSVVGQGLLPKPYYLTGDNMAFGLTTVFHPNTPQPLDILALQMLYGQNTATNAGDTTYSYAVNPFFFTSIWDAGGTDTIDCSNQTNPCLISLDDGTYSSVGLRDPFAGWSDFAANWAKQQVNESLFYDGSQNLAIAFDAVIENAIGGSSGDKLLGNEFANALTGNAGNDILDGRGDIDILTGGPGNDTYMRDATDDSFVEELGGGTDTVQSTVSYTLPAHVENLTLLGTTALNGFGNELANLLVGNSAKNSLSGQLGNDVLRGLKGADVLSGGGGADRFDFDNLSDSGLGSTTRDRITDFNRRQGDRIDLSTIDANGSLAGNGSFQFISGAFSGNSTGKLRFDAAKHIVYGSTDADTAAEFSILLVGVNSVAGRDFIL